MGGYEHRIRNMEKTQTFQIADISAFAHRLPRLSEHNPDYDLTKRELLEKGLVGVRVYESLFPCEDVKLIEGVYDEEQVQGKPEAEAEPAVEVALETEADDSPNTDTAEAVPTSVVDSTKVNVSSDVDSEKADVTSDSNSEETNVNAPINPDAEPAANADADVKTDAGPDQTDQEETVEEPCLLVEVSGEKIGYIRKANYPQVKALMENGSIVSMSAQLYGGKYRMLFEDDILEDGDAGYYGLLTVVSKEAESEKSESSGSGSTTYISTSYDTVLLEERGRRGNGALVIALILGAFYLGFSVPYWIMIRRGMITASPILGGDLPNKLLNPHLALVIAAVAVTIVALFMKNCIMPMIAALLFAFSAWTLPGYALFTTPSAVLCMIAALRKPSKPLMAFIKVLVFLGVLGVCGWLLKDTATYFWNNKTFMIRPTGHETPSDGNTINGLGFEDAPGAEDDDEDYDDGDFDDDEDFEDDDVTFDNGGFANIGW